MTSVQTSPSGTTHSSAAAQRRPVTGSRAKGSRITASPGVVARLVAAGDGVAAGRDPGGDDARPRPRSWWPATCCCRRWAGRTAPRTGRARPRRRPRPARPAAGTGSSRTAPGPGSAAAPRIATPPQAWTVCQALLPFSSRDSPATVARTLRMPSVQIAVNTFGRPWPVRLRRPKCGWGRAGLGSRCGRRGESAPGAGGPGPAAANRGGAGAGSAGPVGRRGPAGGAGSPAAAGGTLRHRHALDPNCRVAVSGWGAATTS